MGLFFSRSGSLTGVSWERPPQIQEPGQRRDAISVASVAAATNEVRNLGRPAVTDAAARDLGPVIGNARALWPVDSGESRNDLFIEISTRDSTMEISAGNVSPYAAFIRDGDTVRELLVEPFEDAIDKFIDDIAKGISDG